MQTGSVTQGATISCFCLKSMRANAGLARRRMQVAFYRPGGLAFFAVSTADGERKPLSIHSDRRLIRQNPGHAERQLNRGSNHECYRSRSDRLVACGGAADFCRSDMAQMAVAMARHQPRRTFSRRSLVHSRRDSAAGLASRGRTTIAVSTTLSQGATLPDLERDWRVPWARQTLRSGF